MSVVLVTAGYDHKLRFWDAGSRMCTRALRFADSHVNALDVSSDRTLLCAAGYQAARVFEVAGTSLDPIVQLEGHGGNVTVRASPLLLLLLRPRPSSPPHTHPTPQACGFQKENKWAYTASEDGIARIWDMRAPPNSPRKYDCDSPIAGCSLHPNQLELLTADASGALRRWDLRADRCAATLRPAPGGSRPGSSSGGGDAALRGVDVSRDGAFAVTVDAASVCRVWSLGGADAVADAAAATDAAEAEAFDAPPPPPYVPAAKADADAADATDAAPAQAEGNPNAASAAAPPEPPSEEIVRRSAEKSSGNRRPALTPPPFPPLRARPPRARAKTRSRRRKPSPLRPTTHTC